MPAETISYTALRQSLSSVLDKIEKNKEIYFIRRRQHADVVMIARDDYESLVETLHLLSNPANAYCLNESLQQNKEGKYKKIEF